MQLYNKLSAEERAQLIDEAGKDRLTLSFYQYLLQSLKVPSHQILLIFLLLS